MKKRKNILALLLCGMCFMSFWGGCGKPEDASKDKAVVEDTQASQDAPQQKYKPSDATIPRQDSYDCPYMGLRFSLPESLLERMDNKEVAMLNTEEISEDQSSIPYAMMCWKTMNEQQRDMEVESSSDSFYEWSDSLTPVGAIGAYRAEDTQKLDELTGCSEHKEIGKSADGSFIYYLSVNPDVESPLQEDINNISYEVTDIVSLQELFGGNQAMTGSLGEFYMEDIEGNPYTQEMFSDYSLTMVNVFATWCTPCVNEIPDLEKLKNEMGEKGVNVVGIVLDAADAAGGANGETLEKAKVLAEKTGATYPFLIPDAGLLNGRLSGIDAVPETFFVDKNGNIVGETYSGSRSLDEWKAVVEKELEGVAQ